METFFNINFEFDRVKVHEAIENRLQKPGSDYIVVAEGTMLRCQYTDPEYLNIGNSGMFAICDSNYVPLYLKLIYGINREQYCGSDIFRDIISSRKYRMAFVGTSNDILIPLKQELIKLNPDVENMLFMELPFCQVDEFDYRKIANTIKSSGADIIWVALGAPKQEYFIHYLQKELDRGIMLGVGAAFKFFSGVSAKRAPKWMIKAKLEFVYRVFQEPKRQSKRCLLVLKCLPRLLRDEYKRKKSGYKPKS